LAVLRGNLEWPIARLKKNMAAEVKCRVAVKAHAKGFLFWHISKKPY